MHRYRVTVTAKLAAGSGRALVAPPPTTQLAGWRLAARDRRVEVLAPDLVRVAVDSSGRDPTCAAERAVADLQRALAPDVTFARSPVWMARRAGLFGRLRVTTGRWRRGGDDGDDGSAGVREPRRPLPPTGSAAAALDLPA